MGCLILLLFLGQCEQAKARENRLLLKVTEGNDEQRLGQQSRKDAVPSHTGVANFMVIDVPSVNQSANVGVLIALASFALYKVDSDY